MKKEMRLQGDVKERGEMLLKVKEYFQEALLCETQEEFDKCVEDRRLRNSIFETINFIDEGKFGMYYEIRGLYKKAKRKYNWGEWKYCTPVRELDTFESKKESISKTIELLDLLLETHNEYLERVLGGYGRW